MTLGLVQIISEKAEKRQGIRLASAAVTGDIKATELLGRPPPRPLVPGGGSLPQQLQVEDVVGSRWLLHANVLCSSSSAVD